MLEVRSISKRLGSLELSDVSLTLEQGQCFVLLGPSGVGKTVFLEIIAGLIRPDSGSILWEGADITATAPEKRRFAMVYQDYALFPHLTVGQNIGYGLRATPMDSKKIDDRIEALAEKLRIFHILKRRPETLSGGEQQRVALARALAARPRLLLLDEPLSALDTNTRQRLRKELAQIHKDLNVPIIHVTHDPQEAMMLGDHVGVMLGNRIRQIATPDELFRKPSDAGVAEFLGLRNVLPVAKVKDQRCLVAGTWIHANAAGDSTGHIWIKPEEILLSGRPFHSSARNQLVCKVIEWENRDSLLAVRLESGGLALTALITHASFEDLHIEAGAELYATFKSSSIHCF